MNRDTFNTQLCEFISRATTPFHAVAAMLSELEQAGFKRLLEGMPWSVEPGGKYCITRNDSSIIAFVVGREAAPGEGMRIVGAHTDSPCLMVKPSPEVCRKGYFQLGVQVYGGVLLNPWFDRDLSLAGRVSYLSSSGRLDSALVDFRDPVAVIPSLAIHLDREANENRRINPQQHILPVLGQVAEGEERDLRALLRRQLQTQSPERDVAEVLDFDLCFYDAQPPALIGLEREFIASARLDNLLSCYAGLRALLAADGSVSTLLVCNDHEEVGSMSAAGAQGPFLQSVLRHLAGGEREADLLAERSMLISTDNAHGVHPNYADKHDDNHGPLLNSGPVIKINASQRYASNAETSGFFRQLCARESVNVQTFVVRSDMACGSTIGPITAGVTGIRTVDVGVPTFAMHSVRELAGSADAWDLTRVLQRFYQHPGPLGILP